MSQDPHAVPYQRVSYEQNPYQAAPYGQPFAPRPARPEPEGATHITHEWPAPARERPAREWPAREWPAPSPQHPQGPAVGARWQETTIPRHQSAPPTRPIQPSAPPTRPIQPDPAAALAMYQKAERKATRVIVASVLCVVGIAAIVLVAAITHQTDAHIELTGPVFMLLGLANLRRGLNLRARCRSGIERLSGAAFMP